MLQVAPVLPALLQAEVTVAVVMVGLAELERAAASVGVAQAPQAASCPPPQVLDCQRFANETSNDFLFH